MVLCNQCNCRVYAAAVLFGALLLIGSCADGGRRAGPDDARATSSAAAVVNLNSATAEELEKLPHIGPKLARDIIEFRNRNGPFRRVEHLLLIDGISESKFREVRPFIKAE